MVPSRSISLSLVYGTSDIRIQAVQSFISNLGGLTGQTSCCLGNVSVKIWFQSLMFRWPSCFNTEGRSAISQGLRVKMGEVPFHRLLVLGFPSPCFICADILHQAADLLALSFWSTGCLHLWEMHSADKGCNPTLCNEVELGLTSREQVHQYRRLNQSISVLT